ncbi:hypothetical protein [Leeia sp.]|uniref:hypothetical protein n=1 Tax=Leeia sp. TaxID=2884678 RepID=UPI0035B1FC79
MRWRAGVWLVLFCLGLPAVAAENKAQKKLDLYLALQLFAHTHDMTDNEVNTLYMDALLNGEGLVKGGIGVVNKNIHIVVNSPVNEVIIGKKKYWRGAPVAQPEVLITDGVSILKNSGKSKVDMSKAVLLIFSQDDVRFLNLSDYSGGRYLRRSGWLKAAAAEKACQAQAEKGQPCPPL